MFKRFQAAHQRVTGTEYLWTALTGLLAGVISTAAMSVIEAAYWRRWGLVGVLEWHENQVIWSRLRKAPRSQVSYIGVLALHFLNGALAAVPFPFVASALAWPRVWSAPIGLAYGAIVWLLTLYPIHEPVTGVSLSHHPDGPYPVAASLFGHLVYGLCLGVLAAWFF